MLSHGDKRKIIHLDHPCFHYRRIISSFHTSCTTLTMFQRLVVIINNVMNTVYTIEYSYITSKAMWTRIFLFDIIILRTTLLLCGTLLSSTGYPSSSTSLTSFITSTSSYSTADGCGIRHGNSLLQCRLAGTELVLMSSEVFVDISSSSLLWFLHAKWKPRPYSPALTSTSVPDDLP